MTRRSLMRVLAVIVVVAGLAAPPASASVPAGSARLRHCVSLVGAAQGGTQEAGIVRTDCFGTFAQAIRRVVPSARVARGLAPAALTEAMLSGGGSLAPASLSTVIGVDWEDIRRGGRSRVYYVDEVDPCADGVVWEVDQLDLGWDRMISSGEGFGGCTVFQHWEHADQDGAVRVCRPYCGSMRELNDEVSSLRWRG